eukprot:14187890-Alexandrium_andersonii.AAC.1
MGRNDPAEPGNPGGHGGSGRPDESRNSKDSVTRGHDLGWFRNASLSHVARAAQPSTPAHCRALAPRR